MLSKSTGLRVTHTRLLPSVSSTYLLCDFAQVASPL